MYESKIDKSLQNSGILAKFLLESNVREYLGQAQHTREWSERLYCRARREDTRRGQRGVYVWGCKFEKSWLFKTLCQRIFPFQKYKWVKLHICFVLVLIKVYYRYIFTYLFDSSLREFNGLVCWCLNIFPPNLAITYHL